jgi:hypothetical protein
MITDTDIQNPVEKYPNVLTQVFRFDKFVLLNNVVRRCKMEKIKLNKQKLNEKWQEGGRVTNKWCNYYLVERCDKHYLIEVANWKAYLIALISSPLYFIPFILSALQWLIERIAERVDLSETPVSKVLLTLFTKDKVRTDWVKKKELHNFKDC